MNKIIEFISVDKVYGPVKALNDLSFSIEENESVGLIGNNGCGKTTTVNILSNIIPYNSGEVRVSGRKISPRYVSYKSRLGILLSPYILIEDFTPYEYLTFVCKFQNVPGSDITQRIRKTVSFFGIHDYERKKIQEYSSGEKMKIAISASIIHNPEIFVFDEPFLFIDYNTSECVLNLLKSMKGKKTFIITSNYIEPVLEVCDKILIMEKGKVSETFHNDNTLPLWQFRERIFDSLIEKKVDLSTLDWLK